MLINRPEFHLVDAAAMHLGATCFSIYNTSSPDQIEYLLGDAANRVLVTEQAFLDRVLAAKPNVPTPRARDRRSTAPAEGAIDLDEVEAGGDADFDFEAAWRAVEPDDVLCLIYTSGTTGPPKGVQLTHANIVAEMRAIDHAVPDPAGHPRDLLPAGGPHRRPAGSATTTRMFYGLRSRAAPTRASCSPTWSRPGPRSSAACRASGRSSRRRSRPASRASRTSRSAQATTLGDRGGAAKGARRAGGPARCPPSCVEEHAKAEELVLSKMRARLGLDEVQYFVVGAAATPPRGASSSSHAIGIEILELWGMSETSAVAT